MNRLVFENIFIPVFVTSLSFSISCGAPEVNRNSNGKHQSTGQGGEGGSNDSGDATPQPTASVPQCDDSVNSCGQGGTLGLAELKFSDATGTTGVFKIDAPADMTLLKSYGLLVYLHGEGAADYDWFSDAFRNIAKEQNFVALIPKAPDGETWQQKTEQNATYLDSLIQTFVWQKYNIQKERIYLVGVSGGQTFLASSFIPEFAHKYQGGAVMLCGGFVPPNNPFVPVVGKFQLYFQTGTKDFMLEKTKEAIKFYQDQGMILKSNMPEGIGHCRFSLEEAILGALKDIGGGV